MVEQPVPISYGVDTSGFLRRHPIAIGSRAGGPVPTGLMLGTEFIAH